MIVKFVVYAALAYCCVSLLNLIGFCETVKVIAQQKKTKTEETTMYLSPF